MQNQFQNLSTKNLHQSKSKEDKSKATLHQRLHKAVKEHLGYKLEDKAYLHLMSVLEYVLYDILNVCNFFLIIKI